jgi:regulator of cell morphogenesis and NO signaling
MKKTKKQTEDPFDKMIGEYITTDCRTARVFEKYGIDFCFGGEISLSAICKEKSLDLQTILHELELVKNSSVKFFV